MAWRRKQSIGKTRKELQEKKRKQKEFTAID
jgi:hypothetical protein